MRWKDLRESMSARSTFFGPALLPKMLRYRWLIYELVLRDLRLRYRGSVLGFTWTLLNPLLFTAVYVLIFGVFLNVGLKNYALYLLCGLLPWNWLAGAAQQGTTAIVDGRNYVGKTIFPTEALVVVPMLSNGVNFLFSLPLLGLVVLLYHVHVGWDALPFLCFALLVQAVNTLAVLFLLATLNVFYRDFQQLVVYLLLLLFYLAPIVYPPDRIPSPLHDILLANPFAIVIGTYQDLFYRAHAPDVAALAFALACGVVGLGIAYAIFERNKESMGEFL